MKNLKKTFAVILASLTLAVCCTACGNEQTTQTPGGSSSVNDNKDKTSEVANLPESPISDFEYKDSKDGSGKSGIYILKYIGADSNVVIPKAIDNKPVTMIASRAFKDSSIESVTIPNGVTEIDLYALSNSSMKNIYVSEENKNFSSKDGVLFNKDKTELLCYPQGKGETYTIPDSVTSIGYQAFFSCVSLEGITIPNSVTSINSFAFACCESLKSLTIPNSVTSIGHNTFDSCTSLTSITIPDSVTSIDDSAFNNCKSLESVTISNSITSIKRFTFSGCTSLKSVTIPNSVTSIDGNAFLDCKNLESVTISDNITSIGDNAFCRCKSLTSITIPNGVTFIGRSAFYGCTNLKSATIPDSVVEIKSYAFDDCDNLTFYVSKGSAAEKYAKENKITFKAQ